jgi:hypothetical protein
LSQGLHTADRRRSGVDGWRRVRQYRSPAWKAVPIAKRRYFRRTRKGLGGVRCRAVGLSGAARWNVLLTIASVLEVRFCVLGRSVSIFGTGFRRDLFSPRGFSFVGGSRRLGWDARAALPGWDFGSGAAGEASAFVLSGSGRRHGMAGFRLVKIVCLRFAALVLPWFLRGSGLGLWMNLRV